MGSINETVKDSEGNKFSIFDETSLYDDSQMGDNLSDFEILQILTEDQNQNQNQKQCIVIKVRSLKNNKLYAMKKINNNINIYILQKLVQLNNPHILKYYKFFNENNNYYLIMELMNNDNINNFINGHYKLNITTITTDAEKALINGINNTFTNITRVSCLFHLKQNLFKKARESGLLSTKSKKINSNITKNLI